MTVLDGTFSPLATKEFPPGSFYLDMAQPMANAAFYYLEPQARDGFVGWSVLDDKLRAIGADKGARDLSDLQSQARSEIAPVSARGESTSGPVNGRTRPARAPDCASCRRECRRHARR